MNEKVVKVLTKGSTEKKLDAVLESESGNFKFQECSMEPTGDITCSISKAEFENVSKSGIKPQRLVFEIKD